MCSKCVCATNIRYVRRKKQVFGLKNFRTAVTKLKFFHKSSKIYNELLDKIRDKVYFCKKNFNTKMSLIDQPKTLRAEDAFDTEAVFTFLKKHIPNVEGTLEVKQFSGGASNLTYQLSVDNQQFIMRCPPKGTKAKGAHDMAREYNIMSALKPMFPDVPKMIAYTNDESIMGREFYLMEKITGIIPRANMPKELQLSEADTRKMCLNVIDKLIALHQLDLEKTGLATFGKGEGYIQRQIDGWCARYEKAKTWNVPSCQRVMDFLKKNIPNQERKCFIHNDFRLDNVVFNAENPTEVIGILDWEMATIGDPLMDLGNSMAYWVQADDDFFMRSIRRQPTHLKGMLKRNEVVSYYLEKMNFPKEDFTFYEVYGLFRLAVILQQIYYRYHHKQTTNPMFKNLWLMVIYLNWRCKRLIR
jgi:aminoglycoside phosphotransferase (APT) family kinase protein